jgi:peptidyl-tRNA hydrolase, PTH1 family
MTTASLQLIVGLGNPGPQYDQTRHNAGAEFVSALAQANQATLKPEKKFFGLHTKIRLGDSDCHCLIPTTFMNLSGQAVAAIANFYKIPVTAILVAHDELDIAPGTARFKNDGGHGGHNGLRDIISKLGSREFKRLRLGIGHPGESRQVVDFVLKRAPSSERELLEASIDEALRHLPEVVQGNWNKAQTLMNGFNTNK